MSGEVYDVSFSHGALDAGQMARYGAAGVIGYVSADPRKNLTRADVDRFHAAGLAVAVVHENTAEWSTWDDKGANALADGLGLPWWRPIYYAADRDLDPAEYPSIAARLDAMTGRPRGIYAESGCVEYCLDHAAAGWGWLTNASAWSHDPAPRACLRQLAGVSPIAGTDQNVVLKPDWGQWPAEGGDMSPQPMTMVHVTDGPHAGEIWLADGNTATWCDGDAVTRNQYLGIGGPTDIGGDWLDDLALLPTPASIAAGIKTA